MNSVISNESLQRLRDLETLVCDEYSVLFYLKLKYWDQLKLYLKGIEFLPQPLIF